MRSIRRILNRLIHVRNNDPSPSGTSRDLHPGHPRSKAKKKVSKVKHRHNHHRSRQRRQNHKSARPSRQNRSITHTTGSQRVIENSDVCLRPPSPPAPPDGAPGARRAPFFVQPSRSPRPPFEESARNLTRRTPGSEDANSIVTEIGIPVVGPATQRYPGLTSTFFQQDVVTFSQDVSTNTFQSESNYAATNSLQAFSDGNSALVEPITVTEDTDDLRRSTESQTNHQTNSTPLVPLPGISAFSQEPVSPSEPPQDRPATAIPPRTIGSETSPFRPIPYSGSTSARDETNPDRSQSGRLPTNFYFPSQMRRNRSNTGQHSPGRRATAISDDTHGIESRSISWSTLKVARACSENVNSLHGSLHPICLSTGCVCWQSSETQPGGEVTSDALPIEIMIHSLHCQGDCKIATRLDDFPQDNTIEETLSLPPKYFEVRSENLFGKGSTDLLIVPTTAENSQNLALNVMSCVTQSDLPNNLNLSDVHGNSVRNADIRIIPFRKINRGVNKHTTPIKRTEQPSQESTRQYLPAGSKKKCVNRASEEANFAITSTRSDGTRPKSVQVDMPMPLVRETVPIPRLTPPKLRSLTAIQVVASAPLTSEAITVDPENHTHKVDCSTQSILRGIFPRTDKLDDGSPPLTPRFTKYDIHQDYYSPDPWNDPHSNCAFKKRHSECISEEDSYESVCHKRGGRAGRYPRKHSIHLGSPVQLINQACGPDYSPVMSSIGVGSSLIDPLNDMGAAENENNYNSAYDDWVTDNQHSYDVNLQQIHYSKTTYQDAHSNRSRKAERMSLTNPLLVVTLPEKGSKGTVPTHVSENSIDMQNHLYVKRASGVSFASSVFIGDDGKATVTNKENTCQQNSLSLVGRSRETQDGPCTRVTGAIPKRELGAKPKMRAETLGVRKKMLVINDDTPMRDRSTGMDDVPNLARSHRVISERNRRGRYSHQLSSRKNHLGFGIKNNLRRSPGRWTRRSDSSEGWRSFKTIQTCPEKPFDELRSIWINPETERSFPSSNSTIDIDEDSRQAYGLSDISKITALPTEKSNEQVLNTDGEIADKNLKTLECAVCNHCFEPPIRYCKKGHGVCANCVNQGHNCPVCQTAMPAESSKETDLLSRTTQVTCKRSKIGGRETYWMDDHVKHESRFLYRPRACPYANRSEVHCTWKGVRSGIRSHMKRCHGHVATVHPLRTLFPVGSFDSKLWTDRMYDVEVLFVENEIFELHKVFDARRSCLWGLLRHILAKDASVKFSYSIRFQPQGIRSSVTYNGQVVAGSEGVNQAFDKGKRFKFYLDSFSQEPLQIFNIQLKVTPKPAILFNSK